MKKIISLISLCILLSGCATSTTFGDSQFIQSVLNEILPPGFEGDLDGAHDGFYFGTSVHLDINLHGLKEDADGKWTWTGGGYKRSGFFSTGHITLTPKQP